MKTAALFRNKENKYENERKQKQITKRQRPQKKKGDTVKGKD
jgi:hypothetical protein